MKLERNDCLSIKKIGANRLVALLLVACFIFLGAHPAFAATATPGATVAATATAKKTNTPAATTAPATPAPTLSPAGTSVPPIVISPTPLPTNSIRYIAPERMNPPGQAGTGNFGTFSGS